MLLSAISLTSCEMVQGFVEEWMGKITTSTTAPEDKVRTTITETEWLNMYELTNYTVTMEMDPGKYVIEISEDFVRLCLSDGEDFNMNITYDRKNGCLLSNTSVGWLAYPTMEGLPTSEDIMLKEMGILDEIEFSALTYDEQKKSYIYSDEYDIYEFSFKDGVLYSMEAKSLDPEDVERMEISKVGVTVVEIGEYTIANDGMMDPSKADVSVRTTVTSEELAAHLDIRNATACAATFSYGEVGDISVKLAENGLELSLFTSYENENQYFAIADGVLYSLYDKNGVYVGSKYAYLEEIFSVLETVKESLSVDALVYDEEGRYYVLNLEEGASLYFYFENGQLVKGAYVIDYGYGEFMELHFALKDVGTTIVELPEYTLSNSDSGIIVD